MRFYNNPGDIYYCVIFNETTYSNAVLNVKVFQGKNET